MFPRRPLTIASVALTLVAIATTDTSAANVTVTPATTAQTIDGFGAFWGMPGLYRPAGTFWMDRPTTYDIDRFVTEFGASMVRFEIPSTGSPAQGAAYDWVPAKGIITAMRELIKRGTNRFIVTAWSPPAWMKYTKSAIQGGVLDPANAEAYADYLASFCKMVKDSTGVEPYALSVQNEPQFVEPYESAIMADAEMSKQLNLTQPKLTEKGLTTRFFGAEHMMWAGIGTYTQTVANPNLYAFAVHGYTEGVTPDYGNDAAWTAIKNGAGSKRIWMTESSPLPTTAVATAQGIHMSLVSGNLSAWVWWEYSNNCGTHIQTNGVSTSWVPNPGYYGTRHYARFVRPGAIRIGCTSNEAPLWVTAFKNTDNSYAVVLVNTSATATTATISGLSQTWNVYLTDGAGNNCKRQSATSNGTGLAIPGNGVVTLFSGAAVAELGADTTANSVSAPVPDNTIGLLNGFGDDVLRVWVNGAEIPRFSATGAYANNVVKRQVALTAGDNVISCYVKNVSWGGGLLASMLLPPKAGSTVPETLKTDGSWKVTYKNPETNPAWNSLTFDDSKWILAKDAGEANMWPGFVRWGTMAVNMSYQKARWILGGTKSYFRKNITFSAAYNAIYVRGNNFKYKMYLDGVMVKEGSEFYSATGQTFLVPSSTFASTLASGSTHCIAFEITDASSDGNGVLMKAGCQRAGGSAMTMDTTWWCADDTGATGWNKTTATDNSAWTHPNRIDAYDEGGGAGSFIYPGEFWFRKKFTATQATEVLAQIRRLSSQNRIGTVTYFNLQGRQVNRIAGRLPAASSNLLLKRVVYENGTVHDSRQVKTR